MPGSSGIVMVLFSTSTLSGEATVGLEKVGLLSRLVSLAHGGTGLIAIRTCTFKWELFSNRLLTSAFPSKLTLRG